MEEFSSCLFVCMSVRLFVCLLSCLLACLRARAALNVIDLDRDFVYMKRQYTCQPNRPDELNKPMQPDPNEPIV